MGQYCKDGKGGNGQSLFNSLFNGEGLESERIGESRYAPHAFVCILGGIQPSMARRCFDQESFESGFASRFMVVAPPTRIATWSDHEVSEETEAAYHQLILAILALNMEPVYENNAACEWDANGETNLVLTNMPTEPVSLRPILIETTNALLQSRQR